MITHEPDIRIMNLLRDGTYGIWDYNKNRITATGNPGKNWIFPDMPRVDLVKNSYPRVGIVHVSEGGDTIGFEADTEWDNVHIAFFVVSKKDLKVPYITGKTNLTITDSGSQSAGSITLEI